MSQEKKHTDDIFKDKFKDFNIEPAPAIWDNIESSVAASRRKKLILTPIIGIAASLLILAIPTWYFNFNPFSESKEIYTELISQDSTENNATVSEKEILNNQQKVEQPDSSTRKNVQGDKPDPATNIKKDVFSSKDDINKIKDESINGNNSTSIATVSDKKDSDYNSNLISSKDEQIKFVRSRKVIVVSTEMAFDGKRSLALGTNLDIPSKIKWNRDYNIIRENLAFINKEKKTIRNKMGIHLDLGQSGSGSGSSYVYHPLENSFHKSDLGPFASREATVAKPSVKLKNDFGISLELPVYKNISIVSGIRYLSFSDDKSQGEEMIASLGSIKDMEDIYIKNIDKLPTEISQSFSNIEIPLQLKYYIINKRLSVYISGGMGLNILVNNKADIILSDKSVVETKTNNLSRTTYSSIVGLGISYNFNDWIYLSIEPKYRHYFKSFSDNKAIEIKPDITNISFGVGFKF